VLNCLASGGIYTVGELCRRRRTEILSLNNLGHKSFSEILDFVEGIGLDLDMDVDELYRERLSELLDKEDVK
jgi:DNA-directed RNA polymerase alpha subunit